MTTLENGFIEIISDLPEKISSHLHSLERIQVKALLLGGRIYLKKLGNRTTSHSDPIFLLLPENGLATVFHYGAVVFFNLKPQYEPGIIEQLLPYVSKPFEMPDNDALEVSVKPSRPEGIYNDVIYIKIATRPHLELIATILSKSVVLDYYEQRVASTFDNIEPLARNLKEKGALGQSSKEILQLIGANLLTQHEMAGKIALNEKPALLWEHTDLEQLYANLMEDLEVPERQGVLDKKIQLLSHTAETSLDMIQQRMSQRLEWYIIILIMVSIAIESWSAFFLHR
jgi:uncharacterized Rmd1/YagE family protein